MKTGANILLAVLATCQGICMAGDAVLKTADDAASTGKAARVIMESGSEDWVLEQFAGNGMAGAFRFIDGPGLQAGGIGLIWRVALADDGTVYVRSMNDGLIRITPDGVARLIMEKDGLLEGPVERCAAGEPVWNPKEKTLYMTGPRCLRRVVTDPDGKRRVEVVAGIPDKAGRDDGPAKSATFETLMPAPFGNNQGVCDGMFITTNGVIYLSDNGIRKLENGVVSTVAREVPGFMDYNEDEDLFYLPSYKDKIRGGAVFDPKTKTITRIVGSPRSTGHYEVNHDGPALTEASFNSNFCHCTWDRKHKALWVFGPDEERFRWLKDGCVKTVQTGAKLGVKWCRVVAVDSKGTAYIGASSNPGVLFRLRNTKEVQK